MATNATAVEESDESNDNQQTSVWAYGESVSERAARLPCPHRMRAGMDLSRRWEIDYDEARAYLERIGFLVEVDE